MKTLIIIPAYNESQNIDSVISGFSKAVSKFSRDMQYDYIIINDCSTDNMIDICRNSGYEYINLPINLGIGGGVQTGYMFADEYKYDYAVQLDGDGQHNPEYIEYLLQPLIHKDADIVVGSRFVNKEGFQSSAVRRIGIWILSRLVKLVSGVDIKDVTSGFRAVNKDVIHFFGKNYAQDYPEPESIVHCVRKNFKIQEVPVVMHERQGGKSSISLLGSFYYMIKVSISIFMAGLP